MFDSLLERSADDAVVRKSGLHFDCGVGLQPAVRMKK